MLAVTAARVRREWAPTAAPGQWAKREPVEPAVPEAPVAMVSAAAYSMRPVPA